MLDRCPAYLKSVVFSRQGFFSAKAEYDWDGEDGAYSIFASL